MFSLPSLPTDNLYKFIFIGGLVCLISSFFLTDKVSSSQIEDLKTLDSIRIVTISESVLLKEELNKLDLIIKTYNQNNIVIKKELADFKKNESNKSQQESLLQKALKSQSELLDAKKFSDSLFKQGVQSDKRLDLVEATLNARKKVQERIERNSDYLRFLGLSLIIIGGILWFTKSQRIQDEMLLLSLKMARIEYDKRLSSISTEATTDSPTEESPDIVN